MVAADGPAGKAGWDDPHLDGRRATEAASDRADAWLRSLWGDPGPGVALVAVGSLGRRELCPWSDLDLVLLHTKRRPPGGLADALWYPIWDSGVGLDHSVRTVDDAVSVGTDDPAVVGAALLDARPIAGDPTLAAALAERWQERWQRFAGRLLPVVLDATRRRHEAAGELAALLEPDLRDAKGGQRDLIALEAAARAVPVSVAGDPADADLLLAARAALRRTTARATDRLVLQDQDEVAKRLGFGSADELAVALSAAARRTGWRVDRTWRRVERHLAGPGGRGAARRDRPLGDGLVARDDEVALAPGTDPAVDPTLPLRAAATAATTGLPLADATLDTLAAAAPPLPDPWPAVARDALVTLLGSGRPAIGLLEALDAAGLLERALPEWTLVRSRPQRNAFHRFTVDRHLCEAAAGAAALTRQVDRPDLLLVGAWLHDIGKGIPGRDHTEVGIELVASIGRRLGFEPDDIDVLVAMVRHHLLLPDTALRRDVGDPATAAVVADAVGDRTVLHLLGALAEADGKATGPSAWSPWKAGLVAELVEHTAALLDHRPPPPRADPLAEHRHLVGRVAIEGVVVEATDGRVAIAAADRPGLLVAAAGVLSLHGFAVLAADLGAVDGAALDVFAITHPAGRAPEPERIAADVVAALDGRLALADRLRERDRATPRRPTSAAVGPPAVRVVPVDADRSIVEVRTADGSGVLHRIANAFATAGVDVTSAHLSTMGQEVVDAFYVRGDAATLTALPAAIVDALEAPSLPSTPTTAGPTTE